MYSFEKSVTRLELSSIAYVNIKDTRNTTFSELKKCTVFVKILMKIEIFIMSRAESKESKYICSLKSSCFPHSKTNEN